MRIAVTGGSGYMGTALLPRLRTEGHDAFAVRRGRPNDPAAMWDPATNWVRPGTFDGTDAVVHLSGASIARKRWTAARRAELRRSRIESTHVLIEHLRTLAQPPQVLITASATGFYGDTGDNLVREGAPMGNGFLAHLVADWEREAAHASEFGVRTIFARCGPLVAADSELVRRLRLPFSLGLGGRLGTGRQWFPWVATEDVSGALAFLLGHDASEGPVNIVAPSAITNSAFTRAMGRAFHRPAILPIPSPALRALFGRALADETLLVSQRVYPGKLLEADYRFLCPTIEDVLEPGFVGSTRKGRG